MRTLKDVPHGPWQFVGVPQGERDPSQVIDSVADKPLPPEEHAYCKRAFLHGPKEFRDIRGDQPKKRARSVGTQSKAPLKKRGFERPR